jgi:arginyl-tRNA synthetase
MINLEQQISGLVQQALRTLYNTDVPSSLIQVQVTRRDFEGDYTLVVFPLLKFSGKNPQDTANELGEFLVSSQGPVVSFNVIKGFLNLVLEQSCWTSILQDAVLDEQYGFSNSPTGKKIMVEYSSPNTNKPLHLGHIRNNLLGFSVARILKAAGNEVIMVNLVNDRGIHICKSMLAWKKWGKNITPSQADKKGDHLVGDFYVRFDQEFKKEIGELVAGGMTKEEAEKKAPILLEAQEMLRAWEANDPEVIELWKTMNGWVYEGFDITYKRLGVEFDRFYHESETYLLGKAIVLDGLKNGVLYQKEDSSIWIDLTAEGLDQKLLLRSDGTSVYMTQDIGTAHQRFTEYAIDDHIYVVGNEQNYHFQVLSLALQKLGFDWAKHLFHLSYGMVELPSGKMKSREGTVVDADDLMDEMTETARNMSMELGKLEGLTPSETDEIIRVIGLGALKYFILKVDPKKNMTFNPAESIDFNGNTGPFIQYTHARICSVLRKANDMGLEVNKKLDSVPNLNEKEVQLIRQVYQFPSLVKEAASGYSPALIANFVYELVKEYNQFYHDHSILKDVDDTTRDFRISLSSVIAGIIKRSMYMLGIEVPERM